MSSEKKNIKGDNFSPNLIAQINARQTQLGTSKKLTEDNIIYNNSKTSWLRVSSGVEISGSMEEVGLGEYNKFRAQDFVLFGGVTGREGLSDTLQPLATTTYNVVNDQIIAQYGIGDHTKWGYDPPPSVTSLEIRSIGEGTVRSANLMITAHNPDQFKMIELLYLRLGFSIMVEWGHSVYYDNNKKLQKMDFQTTPFNKYFDSPGSGYKGAFELHDEIVKERKKYNYNYDAFIGFITNFTWTVGDNGEYNINLTASSEGSLIDSLTAASTPNAANTPETNTGNLKDIATNRIQAYFLHWKEKLKKDTSSNWLNKEKATSGTHFVFSNKKNLEANIKYSFEFIKDAEIIRVPFNNNEESDDPNKYYISLGAFLRFIEEKQIFKDQFKTPIISIDHRYNASYMLSHPFQQSVNPSICLLSSTIKTSFTEGIEEAQTEVAEEEAIDGEISNPLPFTAPAGTTSTSLNEDLLASQLENDQNAATYNNLPPLPADPDLPQDETPSENPPQDPPPLELPPSIPFGVNELEVRHFRDRSIKSFNGYQGDIMGIMVNFDFISNLLINQQSTNDNRNTSFHSLLTSILNEISKVTGKINTFYIKYDEDKRQIKIHDQRIIPGIDNTKLPQANFHIKGFQTQEDNVDIGSFVRNFSFQTKVFPEMVNMIALQAHVGNVITPDEGSSLSALNKKIYDRIMKGSIVGEGVKEKKDTKKEYNQSIYNLTEFFKKIYLQDKQTYSSIFSKDRQTALADILKYDLNLKHSLKQLPSPFFIPIELSLTLDGLSGIDILSKFGMTPDYILPPDYPNNLNFIVKSQNHTIKNNEWTTTIETFSAPNSLSVFEEPTEILVGDSSNDSTSPSPDLPIGNENWELIPNGDPFWFQREGAGPLSIDEIVSFLHPNVRNKFRTFLIKLTNSERLRGYKLVLTSEYRSPDAQAALITSGNTIATTGVSLHMLGAVLDINIFRTQPETKILGFNTPKDPWLNSGVVTLAQNSGIKWGGNFQPTDPVHFYVPIKKTESVTNLENEYGQTFSSLTKNQIYSVDLDLA